MRSLWRNTASLLRKYPILWLPVVLARFITFNLGRLEVALRRALTKQLMPWLTHSQAHSVLSGTITTEAPQPEALRKFAALTGPIHFGRLFIDDFVFACALIAIAAILHSFATTGRATVHIAANRIFDSSSRILIFCLKLLSLNLISAWITYRLDPLVNWFLDNIEAQKLLFLSPRAQVALGGSNLFLGFIYELSVLPITLCVVYIMAPVELHLLQPPDLLPTPKQRRQARLAEMTAAIAISILGAIVWATERSLFQRIVHTDLNTYLILAVASLLRAIPYVPLYVAFYLIANPDSPIAFASSSPDLFPTPPESPPSPTSPE